MREIAGVASYEERVGLAAEAPRQFFVLEKLLPLELIRIHTKTADIPTVTDEQLRLYRKAAFEGAMHYSSLFLGPTQLLTEYVKLKQPKISFGINLTRRQSIRTKYQLAQPDVFLYGMAKPMRINGQVGSRKVDIPLHDPNNLLNGLDCCSPCGNSGNSSRIMYYAGYACEEDVPSGILVGMLKFIAWNVMNAGDEIMTVRNRRSIAEAGLTGTNNAAWASGALEMWAQYNPSRI